MVTLEQTGHFVAVCQRFMGQDQRVVSPRCHSHPFSFMRRRERRKRAWTLSRANRKEFPFRDLLQSDVLLCIASRGGGWYPRCIVYSDSAGKLELFLRAVTDEGFGPLKILLGISKPKELFEILNSEHIRRVWHSDRMFHADLTSACRDKGFELKKAS